MKSLLWKDYRINRLLLIFGFVVCVGPWIIAAARNLYHSLRDQEVWWEPGFWVSTASISLGLSLFTFSMLGGNAIAAERSDRSAEFLDYMPVSRWAILASKSVIALSAGTIFWLVNLLILFIVAPRVSAVIPAANFFESSELQEMLGLFGATSVLLFGAGWFWSAVLNSHGLATGMSYFALAVVVMAMIGIEAGLGVDGFIDRWLVPVSLMVGISGFVAGCVYYLRRLEP